MTLSELSRRNARRQTRDYLIYFVTVVMAAALLYAFNGLIFSPEVREVSSHISMMPLTIGAASVVVVGIFGWLVSYATRFMLSRRSRELGTYLLIGLEQSQVARLFLQENLAVGTAALGLGLVLGNLLYQILWAIVLALFGRAYRLGFSFSLPSLGLTLLYFALIYHHALGSSRKRILKMKIHDLIYDESRNQEAVVKSGKTRRRAFGLAPVLGVVGTVFLTAGDLLIGIIGAGCIIAGLLMFFHSFASGVPAWFDKRPEQKYRGQNLLVFRTLSAKMATMGTVMAVISMLLTATFICTGTGMVFRGIFEGRAAENACFDLYFDMASERGSVDPYLRYIDENIPVEQSRLYVVYESGVNQMMDYLEQRLPYYTYGYESDPVMKYSDYAALRAIAGYPAVEPEPGRYIVHCMVYLEQAVEQYDRPVTIGGVALEKGSVHTEHFFQHMGTGNGPGHLLVVPDEAVEGLEVHHRAYAAKTARPVTTQELYDITAIDNAAFGYSTAAKTVEVDGERKAVPVDYVATRANELEEAASWTAVTSLPLYFLTLALTMTAATILTIQLLSESGRYQRQFALLRKLGMERGEMLSALARQLGIYYLLPVLPAALISIPFIINLARLPEPGVMVGWNSPGAIAAVTLGVFALIYGVYLLLAYTSLQRSVLPVE